MKLGILSDTHNNADNTRVALETFRERGISQLIHCGDITTPEIVHLFAGWQVVFVFGNMDRSHSDLIDAAKRIGVAPPQTGRTLEIGDKQIGVTHGHDPNALFHLMMSGNYDYVLHGHTHERRNEYRSAYGVRLINPGSLGGNRPEARSVCVLDLASGDAEFIEFRDLP